MVWLGDSEVWFVKRGVIAILTLEPGEVIFRPELLHYLKVLEELPPARVGAPCPAPRSLNEPALADLN